MTGSIDRRVGQLERRTAPPPSIAVVVCEVDEAPADAWARHCAAKPSDASALFRLVLEFV